MKNEDSAYYDSPFKGRPGFKSIVIILLVAAFFGPWLMFLGVEDSRKWFPIYGLFWLIASIVYVLWPFLYNKSSPFGKGRTIIKSFIGSGMCPSSWLPNRFQGRNHTARLVVYEDGVEFRIYFSRYFIPYNMMLGEPEKGRVYFLDYAKIYSSVPDVPSPVYFTGFMGGGVDKINRTISKQRKIFLEKTGSAE